MHVCACVCACACPCVCMCVASGRFDTSPNEVARSIIRPGSEVHISCDVRHSCIFFTCTPRLDFVQRRRITPCVLGPRQGVLGGGSGRTPTDGKGSPVRCSAAQDTRAEPDGADPDGPCHQAAVKPQDTPAQRSCDAVRHRCNGVQRSGWGVKRKCDGVQCDGVQRICNCARRGGEGVQHGCDGVHRC